MSITTISVQSNDLNINNIIGHIMIKSKTEKSKLRTQFKEACMHEEIVSLQRPNSWSYVYDDDGGGDDDYDNLRCGCTNFGEAIHPGWNSISGETHAGISTKMVAIPSDEMVRVSLVFLSHLFHEPPRILGALGCPSDQDWFLERKSWTITWLAFEDSTRFWIMCTECILYIVHWLKYKNHTTNVLL